MSCNFLFYDLETFGSDSCRSRIAQFAAQRTDENLVEIEPPVSFFVQPAGDLLPSPAASMVTGIAPQDALREGINEAAAFARIFDEMSRPDTCSLGYNSLRFDDEFIRHGLYRNFHDPYEREWRGGNSRWDLLDVMRLAHALRPDGVEWPRREDGAPSFRLDHLAEANSVREGAAHEALSDVRALIGLARRLRKAQPRLWDYSLRLRDKRYAAQLLDSIAMQPLLHVSQRYAASRLCAAVVVPIARHPRIDSRVIVFDLDSDPADLLQLLPEEIADRLYTPVADLPEGVTRIGLKEVHLNKCPALVPWDYLRPADLQRLCVDPVVVLDRAARLREHGPAIAEKIRRVYATQRARDTADADAGLYDGFMPDADKRRLAEVRATAPEQLGTRDFGFADPRLPELLFRYRARNWPLTLTFDEHERWNAWRRHRLGNGSGLAAPGFAEFRQELAAMRALHAQNGDRLALLDRLQAWADAIEEELN